jgi:putative redox protein
MASKPPTIVTLNWLGDLRFSAATARTTITIDSAGVAGPSPVETLAIAVAGCMSMDLAHIFTKGRHAVRSLSARFVGERADTEPRRFLSITLHFVVDGDAPDSVIDRAILLSREKYCSVWHSMREDIALVVTWEREATP